MGRNLILPTFLTAGLLAYACVRFLRPGGIQAALLLLALAVALLLGNHTAKLLPWEAVEKGWAGWIAAALATAGVAAVLRLVEHKWPKPKPWYWLVTARLAVCAAAAYCLAESWDPWERSPVALGLAVVMFCCWEGLLLAHKRWGGKLFIPSILVVWGFSCAGVLIYGHSARFCDLAILMTLSLSGLAVPLILKNATPSLWHDLVAIPAISFPALMLAGAANTWSEVTKGMYAATATAPASLLVILTLSNLAASKTKHLSPKTSRLLAFLLVTLIAITGLIAAMWVEDIDFGS